MSEPWVSIEETARHLGVVRDSIYRWIKEGNLPAHRVGRHWKFKLSEIDEWVKRDSTDIKKRHQVHKRCAYGKSLVKKRG